MPKHVIATIETVTSSFIGSSSGCSRSTISARWIEEVPRKIV